mgnify:CR=1 FL=1
MAAHESTMVALGIPAPDFSLPDTNPNTETVSYTQLTLPTSDQV